MSISDQTPEEVIQTLVIALGTGLALWGAIKLSEGYKSNDEGGKKQGIAQIKAGCEIVLAAALKEVIQQSRP